MLNTVADELDVRSKWSKVLHVRSSSIDAIIHWGFIPLKPSSIEFVFYRCHCIWNSSSNEVLSSIEIVSLTLRLSSSSRSSSIEDIFHLGCLPRGRHLLRLSSIQFVFVLMSSSIDFVNRGPLLLGLPSTEIFLYLVHLPLRLSSLTRSSSIEDIFHFGCTLLRLSSTEVVFHWGCHPLSSPSIEVVFHWGCLPLRSSST